MIVVAPRASQLPTNGCTRSARSTRAPMPAPSDAAGVESSSDGAADASDGVALVSAGRAAVDVEPDDPVAPLVEAAPDVAGRLAAAVALNGTAVVALNATAPR